MQVDRSYRRSRSEVGPESQAAAMAAAMALAVSFMKSHKYYTMENVALAQK